MKKTTRRKKVTFSDLPTPVKIESMSTDGERPRKSKNNLFSNKPLIFGFLVILFVFIAASGLYAFLYFQEDAPQKAQLSSDEVKSLVKEVEEIVLLPKDETPKVATVTDVEKLFSQPFFKNAKNGDKVIMYGSTKEAILYRPSIRKVINITLITGLENEPPVAADSTTSGKLIVTPSAAPVIKIKVAVLNSTKEAGLARKGANLLDKEKYEVISTSNAQGEYKVSTVSKVTGSKVNENELKNIVASLTKVKGEVKPLPNDEASPAGADIIIILGTDFATAY